MDFVRRLVPGVIRRRYAVKFGIALLVLGVSVGVIGFLATGGITTEVEQRVQDDHGSFAGQEAQSLQMWNEQNEDTIATIARSDSVEADDVDAIEHRFLSLEEHLDVDIFRIDYVDTESGEVLTSTDVELRPADGESVPVSELELDEEAFEAADSVVPWVSKAYTTEDLLGQETAVVTYVLDVPRTEDRAIVLTADLDAYTTRFQDTDRVTTLVLDGDDEVMLDTTGYGTDYETLGESYDGELAGEARYRGAFAERIEATPSGALAMDAYDFTDGNGDPVDDYVAGYARVHGTDWVVAVHEPTADAYGFVNAVDQYGTYATLLGVLLIGLVGAVLGRNTAVAIDRLTAKAGRMEQGDLEVEFETDRVDNIGRLYAGFASMRDALREQIEEAQQARLEAESERERVQRINRDLERTADEYSDVMTAAAAGQLTARMDADSDNETMEAIAREFNEMLAEIEATVAGLNRFATEVATASEEVTASSEEVRSASEQVTGSIQEISEGADRQNTSLQAVNDEMSALSTTIEQIAASSNEVADIAERTAETGRHGEEAAREALGAMDEIETESEQAVAEIRHLEEEVQQIDELINSISQIAKQTNMLALNANIEASRSKGGEDDEGFAVVAQEVKELSEDVKEAATEAEERLESIREQTEQSAEEVEKTSAEIDVAGAQVQEAVEALETISTYAQETNSGVQEISAATEEQAASTQEVVSMVDEASTISEETTAEAENVAAAAEEQTTALTEVSRSASDLARQASQLSDALDRFETDAEGNVVEKAVMAGDSDGTGTTSSDSEAIPMGPPDPDPSDEFESDSGATWDDSETDRSEADRSDDSNDDEVFRFGE